MSDLGTKNIFEMLMDDSSNAIFILYDFSLRLQSNDRVLSIYHASCLVEESGIKISLLNPIHSSSLSLYYLLFVNLLNFDSQSLQLC